MDIYTRVFNIVRQKKKPGIIADEIIEMLEGEGLINADDVPHEDDCAWHDDEDKCTCK